MKISYNWLKWYIPDVPTPEKLADIFTYHLCEVENIEKKVNDIVFDINILPNRAHDLLSHQGIAHELASLLNIKFIDPTSKYKVLESKPTNLKIEIKSEKCKRYMGRIIRNIKVGPSPDWVKTHLESIGQRSINNMVDAANIVMYDLGQPTHIFDLDKVKEKLLIRLAKEDESIITLDNKIFKLREKDLVIADSVQALAVAGIKGGKIAEVDENTKNIILEVANFDSTSIRKTAQSLNIFTDARKRFENELSPELGDCAMLEFSALIAEMCPMAYFEDVVDIYPFKKKENKLSFSALNISKILGLAVSKKEIELILKRYNFKYTENKGVFEIIIPLMRLDLVGEEDMAEEVGRILGYDKLKPKIPKINFKIQKNKEFNKIKKTREYLLSEGYSEIMTYTFCNEGEVEVLASASDKKFLRTNLSNGLKDSLKLNQLNMPLLKMQEIKLFEVGVVFKKSGEEIHVAYGDKKGVEEMILDDFVLKVLDPFSGWSSFERGIQGPEEKIFGTEKIFKPWSMFPFITRDIAVWVPEEIKSENVKKIIKNNMGELVIQGPELFDEFKKGNKKSYAFRLIFQSYKRTLTDTEINEIMTKITNKIKGENDWQVR